MIPILTQQVLRDKWTQLEPTRPWRMGTIRQHAASESLPSHYGLPLSVPASSARGLPASLLDIIADTRLSHENIQRGASVVAPDDPTAVQIETILGRAGRQHGLPSLFFAAVMAMETRFAVRAHNGRWDGANPTLANAKTEFGVLQISGDMLREMPGMEGHLRLDDEGRQWNYLAHRACEAQWAVPILCQWLADLHRWALGIIGETDRSLNTEMYAHLRRTTTLRWQNAYWLAALAYDQGRANAVRLLVCDLALPPYPDMVSEIANHFSDLVKVDRFMPDAAGLHLH